MVTYLISTMEIQRKELCHDPATDATAIHFFIVKHEVRAMNLLLSSTDLPYNFPILNGSQCTIPLPKGLVQISEHSFSDWKMPEF